MRIDFNSQKRKFVLFCPPNWLHSHDAQGGLYLKKNSQPPGSQASQGEGKKSLGIRMNSQSYQSSSHHGVSFEAQFPRSLASPRSSYFRRYCNTILPQRIRERWLLELVILGKLFAAVRWRHSNTNASLWQPCSREFRFWLLTIGTRLWNKRMLLKDVSCRWTIWRVECVRWVWQAMRGWSAEKNARL